MEMEMEVSGAREMGFCVRERRRERVIIGENVVECVLHCVGGSWLLQEEEEE